MERPQNILGLTAHVVRLRWQSLSTRGRMLAIGGATFLSLAAATAGVHAMSGHACCASRCASHAAEHGCPHAHAE